MRALQLFVLALAAWSLSLASLAYMAQGPTHFQPPFQAKYVLLWPWVALHGVSAALTLSLGPLLLFPSLVSLHHARVGRLYVLSALLAGLSAIALSLRAEGGLVSQSGFIVLNALWLASLYGVWRTARRRQIGWHQAWTALHYGLACSALLSRLGLWVAAQLEIDFDLAYPVLSWLSWQPGLIYGTARLVGELSDPRRKSNHF